MRLDPQFIDEISQFKTIYCHVSGGVYTSAIAYKLQDLDFKNVINLQSKKFGILIIIRLKYFYLNYCMSCNPLDA